MRLSLTNMLEEQKIFDREPLVFTIRSIDRYADHYFPIKRKGHERDYIFHK